MQELMTIGTAIATVVAVLVGVVVTIVVAYAGFMYATAAGDPQKTGIAKNAFVGAFIGLIIASVAFIGPRIITDMVIKPVGGVAIESEIGLNCDGILRNQLVFQRGASTKDRMNTVIAQIQAQNEDCSSDVWNPSVVDYDADGDNKTGQCFNSSPGTAFEDKEAEDWIVGDQSMAEGLLRKGQGEEGKYKARDTSGRDSDNNVIVYWAVEIADRPSDGASCWLYFARLRSWHENFY